MRLLGPSAESTMASAAQVSLRQVGRGQSPAIAKSMEPVAKNNVGSFDMPFGSVNGQRSLRSCSVGVSAGGTVAMVLLMLLSD